MSVSKCKDGDFANLGLNSSVLLRYTMAPLNKTSRWLMRRPVSVASSIWWCHHGVVAYLSRVCLIRRGELLQSLIIDLLWHQKQGDLAMNMAEMLALDFCRMNRSSSLAQTF